MLHEEIMQWKDGYFNMDGQIRTCRHMNEDLKCTRTYHADICIPKLTLFPLSSTQRLLRGRLSCVASTVYT